MTDTAHRWARPSRWRLGTIAVAIFVLAAVPRLAVVWYFVSVAPDSGTYLLPAKSLVAGHGYVDAAGHPYSFRPPTYPLFLAAVFRIAGESVRWVEVTQALLAAAGGAALSLWMARRHGAAAGAAAGVLVALDPILIPVPAFVLTEALGTLLVPGIVICLEHGLATRRPVPLLLAGLLGGAAALNTPITLLLVPCLLLVAWIVGVPRRPDWRSTALALGLAAACVGAWTARNVLAEGEVVVVRDNGFGSLVWATTEYDFDWLPYPNEPAWPALMKKFEALASGKTYSQAHAVYLRAAWRNIREHPTLVFKRVIKANFWFWIESPGAYIAGALRPARWIALGFHQLQLLALLVGLAVLWRAGRLREWALWIGAIVYFALFLSLMMPIPRYYVPLLPVVDTLIAVGLTPLVGRWRPNPAAGTAPAERPAKGADCRT